MRWGNNTEGCVQRIPNNRKTVPLERSHQRNLCIRLRFLAGRGDSTFVEGKRRVGMAGNSEEKHGKWGTPAVASARVSDGGSIDPSRTDQGGDGKWRNAAFAVMDHTKEHVHRHTST